MPRLKWWPYETGRMSPSIETNAILSNIPTHFPRTAGFLREFFASRNISAYLVGGAVRDSLLGRPIGDIDVAVDGDPLRVGAELARSLGGSSVAMDEPRKIVRVAARDGDRNVIIDLSPIRGNIEEDLGGRDFTVNAMALPMLDAGMPDTSSETVDPYGGLRDLDAGVLRSVRPSVFADDPARLMRAPRIAAQLGLAIEDETAGQIKRDAGLIAAVAPERVGPELLKLVEPPGVARSLRILDELGLLGRIIPEMAEARGVAQPSEHHWDVFDHCVETAGQVETLLQETRTDSRLLSGLVPMFAGMEQYFAQRVSDGQSRLTLLKLTGLLHDIGKPSTKTVEETGRIRFLGHHEEGARIAAQVLTRLRFSRRGVDHVTRMVQHHLRPGQMAERGELPSRRAIYRFYRDADDVAVDTLYLNMADYLAARGPDIDEQDWSGHCRVIDHILREGLANAESVRAPGLVNGTEIMTKFSLPPGPVVGQLLEAVREAQAAGEISSTREAIQLVKSRLDIGDSGA